MRGYAWTGTENSVGRESILSRRVFTLLGRTGVQESAFVEKKNLGMGDLRTDTGVYIKRIGDVSLDGYGCTVAKKMVQGHSGKKYRLRQRR